MRNIFKELFGKTVAVALAGLMIVSAGTAAELGGAGSIFGTLTVNAADNDLTWVTNGTGVSITGYNGSKTELVIPDKIGGKTVNRIESAAFMENSKLTSVTLPEGLESIGDAAFSFCTGLESIRLPASVNTVGDSAFMGCESMTSIEVDEENKTFSSVDGVLMSYDEKELICCPNGRSGAYVIPDSVSKLNMNAFTYCQKLTSVKIPAGVSDIDMYAFGMCDSLNKIDVEAKNKNFCSVGGVLFSKDKKTIVAYPFGKKKSYVIPAGTERIEGGCFAGFTESVSIPDGIKEIGECAFAACTNLANIKLPDSVEKIEEGAFSFCVNLQKFGFPAKVTEISDAVLQGCTSLKNVFISGSINRIGEGAFAYCVALESITDMENVSKLDGGAFLGCVSLSSVVVRGEKLNRIGEGAFAYCAALKVFNICPSVQSVGDIAFFGCDTMKKFYIPPNVKVIGEAAFGYSEDIYGNVTAVKNYMIEGKKGSQAQKYANRNGFSFRNAIYPERIVLSKTSKTLGRNEVYTLKADIYPSDATVKELTWKTNSDAVTVKDGTVKAVGTGSAMVSAESGNGVTATCLIQVKAAPSKVTLNKTAKTIGVGETYTLKATLPEGSASGTMKWTTSNSGIVTVKDGKLTAKKAGTATVTVKTYNGKTASCKVTVKAAPSKVTLNKTKKTIGVGEEYTLKVTLPDNTASGTMKWTTSNSNVVAVKDGVLTAKKAGTATITVKTFNGKTATCKITVKAAPSKVTLSKTTLSMKKGETYTLKATLPANTASGTMKWTSSNTNVVTVKDGKLTAKKAGTAIVTVKTFNGKTATCKVTVK